MTARRSPIRWFALLGVIAATLGCRAALAGRATGQVKGYVFDQTGSPLPAVKVTASLLVGRGRPWTTYSNSEGAFLLSGLPVGRVTVRATAPRLREVTIKDVSVSAGGVTELNIVMEVRTRTEEAVVVMEKAPAVPPAVSMVTESYDMELVDALPLPSAPAFNTESYAHLPENPFLAAAESPLSTFGLDVDTASYANTRRFLEQGTPPPASAVRIEELVNYFRYSYPPPTDGAPLAASFEVAACPWNPEARLVRVGLRGKDVPLAKSPPSNLVFLVDVSGSMTDANKLPLVKRSLRLLVEELRPSDRIAMVVYAGQSGLVLPSTPASERARILEAIERLEAGGSTNGGAGIELAYRTARQAFLRGGNNRVLLATDGDFNVGVTSEGELVSLIQAEARTGVFLTVLGFGTGNLKDSTMERLADLGNGQYAYIDSLGEARRVLVEQLSGTLLTIAKDVKLQVEMNPARIGAYRLLGYENRLMAARDFNDDRKDGGELGAGHTVTALYEILPPGAGASAVLSRSATVDALRYSTPGAVRGGGDDLLTVKVRYKAPDGDESRKLEWSVREPASVAGREPSADLRFAAAVAAFGMVLRGSPNRGVSDLDLVERLARQGQGADAGGHRRQFLELVGKARQLQARGWSLGSSGAAAGLLTIARDGRPPVRLGVTGPRIDGQVGGMPFHVVVKPAELEGHVGGEPLWMWMRGRDADGHIGGHGVGFVLNETPRGHLLRGKSVGHTVRLEEANGELAWIPSCERPLVRLPRTAAAETVFQGRCASGQRIRLTLPDAFMALPPLPRLALLGLLLTEEDERLSARTRALFPVEGGR